MKFMLRSWEASNRIFRSPSSEMFLAVALQGTNTLSYNHPSVRSQAFSPYVKSTVGLTMIPRRELSLATDTLSSSPRLVAWLIVWCTPPDRRRFSLRPLRWLKFDILYELPPAVATFVTVCSIYVCPPRKCGLADRRKMRRQGSVAATTPYAICACMRTLGVTM